MIGEPCFLFRSPSPGWWWLHRACISCTPAVEGEWQSNNDAPSASQLWFRHSLLAFFPFSLFPPPVSTSRIVVFGLSFLSHKCIWLITGHGNNVRLGIWHSRKQIVFSIQAPIIIHHSSFLVPVSTRQGWFVQWPLHIVASHYWVHFRSICERTSHQGSSETIYTYLMLTLIKSRSVRYTSDLNSQVSMLKSGTLESGFRSLLCSEQTLHLEEQQLMEVSWFLTRCFISRWQTLPEGVGLPVPQHLNSRGISIGTTSWTISLMSVSGWFDWQLCSARDTPLLTLLSYKYQKRITVWWSGGLVVPSITSNIDRFQIAHVEAAFRINFQ